MTSNDAPTKLKMFWRGYLTGTNRGTILLRLKQNGGKVCAKAVVLDHQFGPAVVWLNGTLSGAKLELRFADFRSEAGIRPLDGTVILNINEESGIAEGTWQTDIGTSGVCRLHASSLNLLCWGLRLVAARLRQLIFKWAATIYLLFVLAIAIANLSGIAQLSWPVLVLLLLPAPFLFASDLARLIAVLRGVGVRKLGLLELDQNPPPSEIVEMLRQQTQETVTFFLCDNFFVLRTKLLLILLAQQRSVDRAEFNALATGLGVPNDNIETTWNAILSSRCAKLEGSNVIMATDLGLRYTNHLVQHSPTSLPSQ
jgi:hypothetical protein